MYITPQSNIKLLHNVPLDNTYDHTIYFSDASSQTAYFSGLTKYNLTNYSYNRVNSGVLKVGILADNIYDCNYLMFQNSAFGNKWFYAFITSLEYVNNNTSQITFAIDDMQTWMFDYTLDMCYVEREHSETDEIGEHLEPEPVNVGEYVFNGYEKITNILDPKMVVMLIVDTNGNISDGRLIDGIYSGAQAWCFNVEDVDTINAKIATYAQATDSIIAMYIAPTVLLEEAIESGQGVQIENSTASPTFTIELDKLEGNEYLDGYKPKNKKLYTYPYNFFNVDNATGQSLNLRYEFFDVKTPTFEISGNISEPVQVAIRPTNYKNINKVLNTESLCLANYPQCSWNTDSFAAWFAQNSVPLMLDSSIGAISSGIKGAATGGVGGAVAGASTSLLGSVVGSIPDMYRASIQADLCRGSVNNGGVNTSWGKQTFWGGRCSVNSTDAKIIDDFFTRFGYHICRLKTPNRNARPHWNYVKTQGCTITGSIPADSANNICGIYNKGITFWNNGSEIGDYSLDNSVTSGGGNNG